jgi:PST family polysaccharide transporter
MNDDLGKKTKTGIFWTAFFNVIEFLVRFGSSIILARILFPEDFGLMGLAMIIVQFARRLASFGFNMALVQRKDVEDIHFDTTFWFNFLLFSSVTFIIFISAPYIASFFDNESLINILRVIGFDFILRAFISVPRAILIKKMDFKRVSKIQTFGSAAQMVTPIGFALAGYGVWSLVFGTLIGSFVESLLALLSARWFPKLKFKFQALKEIFSFGMWVNITTYFNYFIKNVDYFFIGKFLGATPLGYYERAFNLMNLPRKRIQQTVNDVLFSAFSKIQDDNKRILNVFLKVTTYISILSYPLMIGLFFAAPALITVLYGSKWTDTIYPFRVMCISGLIYTFDLTFTPVIMGKGLVSLQAIRKFFHFIVLAAGVIVGIKWGINGVAWGVVIAAFSSFIFNLNIITSKMQLSLLRYFTAHRSQLIYGSIQIMLLAGYQFLVKSYIAQDSFLMLISMIVLSVLSFLGSHFIIRFNDVNVAFIDFFSDTKKILRKIPFLRKYAFLST